MSVLRFENVSKQYPGGHEALSDVNFEVAQGEMLFVTGHSGAGKSTLLKLIHLSERPSRGAVVFGGRNLLKVRGGRIPLHRRASRSTSPLASKSAPSTRTIGCWPSAPWPRTSPCR